MRYVHTFDALTSAVIVMDEVNVHADDIEERISLGVTHGVSGRAVHWVHWDLRVQQLQQCVNQVEEATLAVAKQVHTVLLVVMSHLEENKIKYVKMHDCIHTQL